VGSFLFINSNWSLDWHCVYLHGSQRCPSCGLSPARMFLRRSCNSLQH
jgi:hypothetical protein